MEFENYEQELKSIKKRVDEISSNYEGGAQHYSHITNNALANLYSMGRLSMTDSFSKGMINLDNYLNHIESNSEIRQSEQNHPGMFGNEIGLGDSLDYLEHFPKFY